ncbi:unnamed protein product [Timema podura]|uniref:GMIP/FCHO2-like FCH domain-containing protein n=1 Tax=Timema podura TaxID=61482 RepID=A0ABN7NEX4_TIMPD|nr:unnamed protein product [Timema podura]
MLSQWPDQHTRQSYTDTNPSTLGTMAALQHKYPMTQCSIPRSPKNGQSDPLALDWQWVYWVTNVTKKSNIEENTSKLLIKLAKQTGGVCLQGTFGPVWGMLRSSAEKLSNIHLQMVHKVTELVKEVSKYADELHKKHKMVKEEESGTLEVVQAIQTTFVTLQKAKDAYTQKGLEFDKLKKENASSKDLEKAETKLKKAQEDYKNLVDKYSTVKEDFEKKMSQACKEQLINWKTLNGKDWLAKEDNVPHFQDVEEAHLNQMREFLNTYAEVLQSNHDLIGQVLLVHIEFKRQCLEMTVDKLLEQFVLNKYTGLEKPGIEWSTVWLPTSSSWSSVGGPCRSCGCSPSREIAGENDKQVGRSVKEVPATRSVQFEELILTGMSMSGQPSSDSSERPTNGEKLSKKEGNLDCGGQKPKESKTSRRTTSLLNLFMSNSQGTCDGRREGEEHNGIKEHEGPCKDKQLHNETMSTPIC